MTVVTTAVVVWYTGAVGVLWYTGAVRVLELCDEEGKEVV